MTTKRVEYLITVDQKEPFCNSVPSFNNLLKTIDGLVIRDGYMEAKLVRAQYEVQMGEVANDKHRYFHIKLAITNSIAVEDFESLLKSIRTVLSKASGKPVQVLWDDNGLSYAQLAYPLIYDVENAMRKLITKFMLTKVGVAWVDEATPKEVLESIRTKGNKTTSNYLYETDFIQLSNFLFKEYATVPVREFVEKVRKLPAISIEDIQVIIPRSNWERYFSALVNCESEYLRVRWEKLYERRNQVAHNKAISKSEYDEILRLIQEIRPKLQDAIDKLDQILVPDEDRDAIAESAAENSSALFGEFLREWKIFVSDLYELAFIYCGEDAKPELSRVRHSPRMIIEFLARRTYIVTRELRKRIVDLSHLRNVVVHGPDVDISEDTIRDGIEQISGLRREISSLIEEEKRKMEESRDDRSSQDKSGKQ